jgi:hypothetical protein
MQLYIWPQGSYTSLACTRLGTLTRYRSEEKAQIAINDIAEVTGKRAIFLQLDLASLTSVKKAAEQLISLAFYRLRPSIRFMRDFLV